jgi:hypothetical protein
LFIKGCIIVFFAERGVDEGFAILKVGVILPPINNAIIEHQGFHFLQFFVLFLVLGVVVGLHGDLVISEVII